LDYFNKRELDAAVEENDIVVHIAGETHQAKRPAEYHISNVLLAKMLIESAIRFKLKKFIFISTANTMSHGTKENPGGESDPLKLPFANSNYAKSKKEAEEIILSVQNQIQVVILNTTFFIGAFDNKPSSGKLLLRGFNKRLVFCPPGGKNIVNVNDVAQAILNAIHYKKNGELILIANENISYKEFYKKMAIFFNYPSVCISAPRIVLIAIGTFVDLLRFYGYKSQVTTNNMRILCENNFYSNIKSKEQLALNYTPIEEGMKEAVNWFKKENYINAKTT